MYRLSQQPQLMCGRIGVEFLPSRSPHPARSQPTERIGPMRKFLGKFGRQFQGRSPMPSHFSSSFPRQSATHNAAHQPSPPSPLTSGWQDKPMPSLSTDPALSPLDSSHQGTRNTAIQPCYTHTLRTEIQCRSSAPSAGQRNADYWHLRAHGHHPHTDGLPRGVQPASATSY